MHPLFDKASGLTQSIIGAAIEVHRDKGPGLVESIYEWCLVKELGLRDLECTSQKSVEIEGEDGVCLEENGKAVVLVTGSNGYVGSHIVRALLEEG